MTENNDKPILSLVPEPVGALTQDEVMTTNKRTIWAVRMTAQVQVSEPEMPQDRTIDIGVRFLNHYIEKSDLEKIENKEMDEKDAMLMSRFGDDLTPETLVRAAIVAARLLASDLERDFDDPNSGLLFQVQSMIDNHPFLEETAAKMAIREGDDEESTEEVPEAGAAPETDAPPTAESAQN